MHRRNFVAGLFLAPAIIRTPGLLMPIKPVKISSFNIIDNLFELLDTYKGIEAYDAICHKSNDGSYKMVHNAEQPNTNVEVWIGNNDGPLYLSEKLRIRVVAA